MKYKIFATILFVFFATAAFAQFVAQDPTRYVPSGRVLGLGKAYLALADDTGAMYTNPAGLAGLKGWSIGSMSGKFLDEYTYLSFSGYYPTEYGVLGVGFAGTSIGGAYATTIEAGSDPADPIYTIDTTQTQMGNYNNAFILSYGNQADKIPYINKLPQADRISLGASLKLFKVALYGDGIVGGDASGYDMDIGMKYRPLQKWVTLAAAIKNVIPASMGGKLTYTSGHEESYPMVIELGSAFNILGKEDALLKFQEHELKVMLDIDSHPTLQGYPMIMHIGTEWKPLSYLALRAGIDQDAAGDGAGGLTTVSDLAYGVGLYFGGFRFDYAYHTFAGAPNVDNAFFSLSYEFVPQPELKDKIVIDEPADKLITFDERVKLSGTVLDQGAKDLKVGVNSIRFGLKGDYQSMLDLKIGKNRNDVSIYDGAKKLMQSKPLRALRLITFPDVKIGYWVDKPVSLLAMGKVITGYPDGTFRPEGNITRAEMCSLLVKAMSKVQSATSETGTLDVGLRTGFADVPEKHWAAPYIAQAAKLGVVKGYPDNTFKPSGNITRAEGLAMVARFDNISEEAYNNEFNDVRSSNWAATIIAGAYKANILEFLKGKPFEPNLRLLRSETVEMLRQTTTVNELLNKDLLNWNSY